VRETKPLLRVNLCGDSDCKRSLLARLRFETEIFRDEALAALELESEKLGRRPRDNAFARLLSGVALKTEDTREKPGVTHCFFASKQRRFLLAEPWDNPPSKRSLLLAAATADLAIVVVDAERGVVEQTRREAFFASLLGARQLVLAVDRMELAGFSEARFAKIDEEFRRFVEQTQLAPVACIPISSLEGANIAEPAPAMKWYQGPPLLGVLDSAGAHEERPIASKDKPAEVADQFEAMIVWTGEAPLLPGRSYVLETANTAVPTTVVPLKYKLQLDTLEHMAAAKLEQGEVGVCNLRLDRSIAFEPYRENRDSGGFVLIDEVSNAWVGVGLFHFALRRAQNVHWQALDVNQAARSLLKGQKPCVLWYTGLSGAGKSTIANLVDKKLYALGRHSYLLDGDNVRHGLNKDLGFTAADRVENIRRIAEVAKLMVDAGLIVGTAFISPFRAERRMARALLAPNEFIEIFVDTSLAAAEQRDPKGLYKKARRGELKNFTGIDSPYEIPENPELKIDTSVTSPEAAADIIVAFLGARGGYE
jgi:bifunctional enzyme CysN/CysC